MLAGPLPGVGAVLRRMTLRFDWFGGFSPQVCQPWVRERGAECGRLAIVVAREGVKRHLAREVHSLGFGGLLHNHVDSVSAVMKRADCV